MVAQPLVITVSGTATQTVTPDQAKITLLAEGKGTSVAHAIAAHAAEVQSIVQALIACGAEEQNIHGAAPRILEENEPGLPSAEQRSITASRVAGNITLTLNDLRLLAQIVDAGLQAGAAFGGIVFAFKEEAQVRHAILTAAMLDAEISGVSLAATLGRQIGGVLGVAEENVAFDGISEYTARVRVSFALANPQPAQG